MLRITVTNDFGGLQLRRDRAFDLSNLNALVLELKSAQRETLMAALYPPGGDLVFSQAPLEGRFQDIGAGWHRAVLTLADLGAAGQATDRVELIGPLGAMFDLRAMSLVSDVPPLARFTTSFQAAPPPMTVQFQDRSEGEVTAWAWSFGDGATSSEQHPVHVYQQAGEFTITLTVTGPGGSNSRTATITVPEPTPEPTPADELVPLLKQLAQALHDIFDVLRR